MEQSLPSEISLQDGRSASTVEKSIIEFVQKLQLLLKPNENWLPSECEQMWKSLHCVPKQLTLKNTRFLEKQTYFVSPKADGTPVALFCDTQTGSFQKISRKCEEFSISSIDGSRSKIGGFLIDAEEVAISPGCILFLAYDLLAIDHAALSYFGMSECVRSDLAYMPILIGSIIERHRLLEAIVSQSNLPNLFVKPIYNAHECLEVWKMKEKFPYPVDGLIFSPFIQIKRMESTSIYLNCTRPLPTLKWKPLEDLTLDVAVGDVCESNDSTRYFNVYLYKPNAKRRIPINHIKNVRHSQHVCFGLTETDNSRSLHFTEVVEESSMQIKVPKSDSLWAPFSIVEGMIDIQHRTMQFKRIRRDRTQANSIAEANEIISAIMSAIKLSDLKFSVKNPSSSFSIQSFNNCLIYRLPHENDFQLFNDRGLLMFGARFVNSKIISVVSSKERSYEESVITPHILEGRFEKAGCRHLKTFPFQKLRSLFPVFETKMTKEEKRMSDLYAASIFQKYEITVQTSQLFRLRDTCHMEMILCCDLESLFCLRKTCNHFRHMVDDASRKSWLSPNMETDHHVRTHLSSSAYGIGTYLRLRGPIKSSSYGDSKIREHECRDNESWDDENWDDESWAFYEFHEPFGPTFLCFSQSDRFFLTNSILVQ